MWLRNDLATSWTALGIHITYLPAKEELFRSLRPILGPCQQRNLAALRRWGLGHLNPIGGSGSSTLKKAVMATLTIKPMASIQDPYLIPSIRPTSPRLPTVLAFQTARLLLISVITSPALFSPYARSWNYLHKLAIASYTLYQATIKLFNDKRVSYTLK